VPRARGVLTGSLTVNGSHRKLAWHLTFTALSGKALVAQLHIGSYAAPLLIALTRAHGDGEGPGGRGRSVFKLCRPCRSGLDRTSTCTRRRIPRARSAARSGSSPASDRCQPARTRLAQIRLRRLGRQRRSSTSSALSVRYRRRAHFNHPACRPPDHLATNLPGSDPPVRHAIAPATSCGTARPDLSEPSLTPRPARGSTRRNRRETVSLAAVNHLAKGSQHVAHGKIAPPDHVHGWA
jgi:hypothetical protein